MFDDSSENLSLGRAFLWIFFSTVLTLGTALMGWLYYLHLKELRLHDSQYRIIAIVQTSPQKEILKTVYLAECLNLSLDQPVNLYQFDARKAEQLLLASPLIKEVKINKIRPGTLYIDYSVRVPIAYLGDYTNTALDAEGYIFPFSPFFTPKKIPTIYLGLDNLQKGWGSCLLDDEKLQLAFQLLNKIQEKKLNVKQIDVSRAFADSYGQRQMIVLIEREKLRQGSSSYLLESDLLRLDTEQYEQNLNHYLVLRNYLNKIDRSVSYPDKQNKHSNQSTIIDLRIPQLAFIKKEI